MQPCTSYSIRQLNVSTAKLPHHDLAVSPFFSSSHARTHTPLRSTFVRTLRQDAVPTRSPTVRLQRSFVRASTGSPSPSSGNLSPQQSSASSRRVSLTPRAAVTSEPTPESGGGSGPIRLPSPGGFFRKIASSIPRPKQTNSPATPSAPSSPSSPLTASSSSPSISSGSGLKSSAGIRPKSKSAGDTDLDPSRALPLPMTYPDSKPLPLQAVEEMFQCDPETKDCKEVVFQWTGKCTRCNGAGYVTFRRKKGKDFSGKCIMCHGIGYVNRFTVRDDIRVMEDPDYPWNDERLR